MQDRDVQEYCDEVVEEFSKALEIIVNSDDFDINMFPYAL